jgi:hypothetical protein
MASIYNLPETYCPNLDFLTSEEVIQYAITTLTSKKEVLAASIATLEKRLRFVKLSHSVPSLSRRLSFLQVLPQFRCSGELRDIGSNRARKTSNPARPYIWRLSVFSRLM